MDKCLERSCEKKPTTLAKDSFKASADSLIMSVKAKVNHEMRSIKKEAK